MAKRKTNSPPTWMVYITGLLKLPDPVCEYRFSDRRFRFDFAWPDWKIAVEINGGVWTQGRHTRGSGALRDWEKLNLAQALGWKVGQFAPNQLDELTEWLKIVTPYPLASVSESCKG